MPSATNDIRTRLEALTDFTVADLHALAGGDIWRAARVLDPQPHSDEVTISFSLICDPAVAADDRLNFYWANSDGGTPEIIDAGIMATEGQITVANEISDVRDALDSVFSVRVDRVNQTVKGSFVVFSPGPSWQLLIELESAGGALAALGSVVRYKLGTPQIQP